MRVFFVVWALAAAILLSPFLWHGEGQRSTAAQTQEPYVSVLARVAGTHAQQDAYITQNGGTVEHRYAITTALDISLPLSRYPVFSADSRVGEIVLDGEVHALDAELDASWGVKKIGGSVFTGSGVKVGIIDTGINYPHQDLAGRYDPSCSYDFVNGDADPLDDNGHGSHVAGIIAANDNNLGVVGTAPAATLCSYKVLDSTGSGGWGNVIAALDRAVADHVKVINMSIGSGADPGTPIADAITVAANAGLVLVAAAGNSGNCGTLPDWDAVNWPAHYPEVIAVAATDINDFRPCWSSMGPKVEVAAPGVAVLSAYKGSASAYATLSGTSMASPHVAGLVAELVGCAPSATSAAIRATLDATALHLGATGRNTYYGYGRVQAVPAASALGCGGAPTPTPTIAASPTRTSTKTFTPTRTVTPPATPTMTRTFTATKTPTVTPGGPTRTPTPCGAFCVCPDNPQFYCTATPAGSPTPVDTPLPTAVPTFTPTPTNTATPVPTTCS